MNRTCKRLLCLALCLLFCLGCLPACAKKADPFSKNGIVSVTVMKNQKLSIEVKLNRSTLEAHKRERLYLYELLPGDTLYRRTEATEVVSLDLSAKTPLKEKKAAATVTFEIPLVENGIDRRYSAFVTAFSDGAPLEAAAESVQNLAALSTNQKKLQWSGSHKGLAIDDPEQAFHLGTSHGLFSIPFSALLDGGDVYSFGGMEYNYSEGALRSLEERLRAARSTGMQLTLELIPDPLPSYETVAAMMDLLCSRLAGEKDLIFVLMIDASRLSPEEAAKTARFAHLSLRSRTANGRVSVEYGGESEQKAKEFFLSLHKEITTLGSFEWDACILPVCSGSSLGGALTPDRLPEFFQFLKGNQFRNSPLLLNVNGLRFARGDGNKQRANLALAYRLAVSAGASVVFYAEQNDDIYGLYDSEGKNPLELAELYKDLDTELSAEYVGLFNALTNGAFEKVPYTPSHKKLTGTTALGSDGKEYELLYDFSKNDTHGFTAIGSAGTLPSSAQSASLGHPVLFTWLQSGSAPDGEGVRKVLSSGSALQSVFSLSARILLQNEETEGSRVTLRLDGVSRTGTHISYEATATVENGRWQTVIFYVAPFVAEADLSSPCVMTLTTTSNAPEGTEYPLWVDSICVRRPEADRQPLLYTLLILGCAVIGLGFPLALYQIIRVRKLRKARRKERRK